MVHSTAIRDGLQCPDMQVTTEVVLSGTTDQRGSQYFRRGMISSIGTARLSYAYTWQPLLEDRSRVLIEVSQESLSLSDMRV